MKTKLLLVDDQEMNHVLIRALVKEMPIELDSSYDVDEALNLINECEYALILVDYHLKKGCGLDVARQVGKSILNSETPVLFLSNERDNRELIEKCYQAGAVDFVRKPVDAIILKSKLKVFTLMYEQKKALLNAKKEADALVDAKAEFLANMSHEIRTPLNSMIGMVDVLSMSNLSYEQKGYLDLLIKGGENLLTLINEILDYSKIEAGHLKVEKSSFDLKELAIQIIDFQSFKASEKNLSLFFDWDPNLPTQVISDSFRLRQILNNLLSNAIKFTDAGKVVLTIKRKEENILFTVEDTGIGIAASDLVNVFKNFSQVGNQTSRRYGGTGLGLYISKGLVEALGGKIGVISKKGKGSTFSFKIPLQEGKRTYQVEEGKSRIELVFKDKEIFDQFDSFNKVLNYDLVYSLDEASKKLKSSKSFNIISYNKFMRESYLRPKEHVEKSLVICPSDIGRSDITKLATTQAIDYYVLPFEENMFDKLIKRLASLITEESDTFELSEDVLDLPLKILIVDDVIENRMVLKAYLKNSNFTLDFIEDGSFVLEKVKNDFYHLILMDMQMPIMDGYEATMQLRKWEKENELSKTPVVALTAYALQDEVKRCLDMGCDGHLSKPVRLDALKESIAKYAIISPEELAMLEEKKNKKNEGIGVETDAIDNYDKVDPLLLDYIPTYIKNRVKEMPELKLSLETRDFEAIRGSCHKTLGSAASYGLYQLQEIIQKLQASARSENYETCAMYIQALEKYLSLKKN